MRLKDSLVSKLRFSRAGDAELAWIDGQIDMSTAKTDTSAMYEPEDGEVDDDDPKKKKKKGKFDFCSFTFFQDYYFFFITPHSLFFPLLAFSS